MKRSPQLKMDRKYSHKVQAKHSLVVLSFYSV